MSKAKVIVLSVVEQGLTKAEAARRFGVSWRWVHTLVTRYQADGLDGLEPRSRRPRTNPRTTPEPVRTRIIELRHKLVADGLDAGPATIAWHLAVAGIDPPPAISTIRRVITNAGLVRPEPRKRPRTSLHRFQAEQPNETWQSDFTHWMLADGTDAQILNWLDDHSRYLLSCTAHTPVTGTDIVDTFTATVNTHGPPASTLTDNGMVYTTRLLGDRAARNGFEYLLAALGITQKNGSPSHPQTQGKIERFHQTLKRWLASQPPPADLATLQTQLDTFRELYNQHRPHRALDRATPAQAYHARPKARPAHTTTAGFYRVRLDHVDLGGKISLRRAGRMHHLGIGAAHARKPVTILITDHQATVIDRTTGELLATNTIDPTRTYWRNNEKQPGRWPTQPPNMNDDPRHL
jgi:transposase InsO family protein